MPASLERTVSPAYAAIADFSEGGPMMRRILGTGVPSYVCEFTTTLRRVPGKGGWVFAAIPEDHAPTVTQAWGRTPVVATVDGQSWDTSVWRTREGITELAVPRKIRGTKDHGDAVRVRLSYSVSYRT